MTEPPLVDVVIPVYNRAAPVVETIDSVLSQEGPTFHIHVVDDGSTDDSAAVVQAIADRDQRVTLHRQPNRGVSAARNRAISACRGRLLTFIDSDDLMTPGRLAFCVDHLASHPDTDAVVGTEQIEILAGVEMPAVIEPQITKSTPRYYWHCVMMARADIEAIGGYDESIAVSEDIDIALRLRRNGLRVDYVDRVLVHRRFSGDNLTYAIENQADTLLDFFLPKAP